MNFQHLKKRGFSKSLKSHAQQYDSDSSVEQYTKARKKSLPILNGPRVHMKFFIARLCSLHFTTGHFSTTVAGDLHNPSWWIGKTWIDKT